MSYTYSTIYRNEILFYLKRMGKMHGNSILKNVSTGILHRVENSVFNFIIEEDRRSSVLWVFEHCNCHSSVFEPNKIGIVY